MWQICRPYVRRGVLRFWESMMGFPRGQFGRRSASRVKPILGRDSEGSLLNIGIDDCLGAKRNAVVPRYQSDEVRPQFWPHLVGA